MTAVGEPDWHIVQGEWKPLGDVFRDSAEHFWPLVASRFEREFGAAIRPETLAFSALVLPFYCAGNRTWALVEVRLPEDVDAVGLRRWVYFLWDGDTGPTLLDGSSQTIHDFNQRVGIDLGGPDDERRSRAALYLALLTAFLAGEVQPRIERDEDLEGSGEFDVTGSTEGQDYFRSPFLLVAAGGHESTDLPVPASANELTAGLAVVTREAEADTLVFDSPGVADKKHAYRCLYKQRFFRTQFRIVFESKDEHGRWRSAVAEMLEDQPDESTAHWKTVFYSLRPGTIAFICADRHELPASIPLSPERMAQLLRSPHFRGACRGTRNDVEALLPNDDAEAKRVKAALRLLAMNWWQAPVGRSRIDVEGDLPLAQPGEELTVALEAEGPVRVRGHLVFRDVRLRAPLRLRRWLIAGRIDGQNTRAQSAIALQDVTVRNAIPKGQRKDGFQTVPTFPNKAVKLDELRSEGSIELRGLRLLGQVSLRGAVVEGRVLLNGADIERHRKTSACGVVFDQARLGALEVTRSQVQGRVSLAHARVEADADLEALSAACVDARRARIGGRLSLRHAVLGGTADGAAVDAEEAQIGGSLDLSEAWVGSAKTLASAGAHLVLRRARVEGDVDASGLIVFGRWPHETAIASESLHVGGDLVMNRWEPIAAAARHKQQVDLLDLRPTLIKGSVVLNNAVIKGSFKAYWFHVTGDLVLRAAEVGKDLIVSGLDRRAPRLAAAVPLPASASYVGGLEYAGGARGGLDLYQARVGGYVDLAGTLCGSLDMAYARVTGGVYARPGGGTDIPLVIAPAGAGGEVPLSAAEVFNIDLEGLQCGQPLRAVGLQTQARIRLGPATVPALAADSEILLKRTESLALAWSNTKRLDFEVPRAAALWTVAAFLAVARRALRGGKRPPGSNATPTLPGAEETRLGAAMLVQALGHLAFVAVPTTDRERVLSCFADWALLRDERKRADPSTRWAATRRTSGPMIRAWRSLGVRRGGEEAEAILRWLDEVEREVERCMSTPPGTHAESASITTSGLASLWWKGLTGVPLEHEAAIKKLRALEPGQKKALELAYRAAQAALAHGTRELRSEAGPPALIPSRVAGYVRMLDLRCGGGFELPGIDCGSVELRNARIEADLRLRLDDGHAPRLDAILAGNFDVSNTTVAGATVLDGAKVGGSVRVEDTRLQGGLRGKDVAVAGAISLRNSTVAGSSDLRAVRAGELDIADSRIEGAFSATDTTVRAKEGAGGRIRFNNVRTQADVHLAGVHAPDCRIEDSQIGGDLKVDGAGPAAAAEDGAARPTKLGALAITGCRIEGRLQVNDVQVDRDIDLSDSHAVRGLQMGAAADAAAEGDRIPESAAGADR